MGEVKKITQRDFSSHSFSHPTTFVPSPFLLLPISSDPSRLPLTSLPIRFPLDHRPSFIRLSRKTRRRVLADLNTLGEVFRNKPIFGEPLNYPNMTARTWVLRTTLLLPAAWPDPQLSGPLCLQRGQVSILFRYNIRTVSIKFQYNREQRNRYISETLSYWRQNHVFVEPVQSRRRFNISERLRVEKFTNIPKQGSEIRSRNNICTRKISEQSCIET